MSPPNEGRFSLRFESGERAGETIAITHTGMVLGRRPGTSVQVLDTSVSGRHAELVLDEDGVAIRDLGSTNGTRVGGERVEGRRLTAGDVVHLGNVRFTFVDASFGAALPSTGPDLAPDVGPPESAADAGEAVQHVSAERVAKSGRRSILPLLLVVLLLLGGGGAWFFLKRGPSARARALRPVVAVPDNLLAVSYSFEDDEATWTAGEGTSAVFSTSPAARLTGEQGLVADLAAGESALAASEIVKARLDAVLVLQGHLRVDGAVAARLGVRFSSSADGASPVVAWSAVVRETDGFEPFGVTTAVPSGYDRAAAVVVALAPGAESEQEGGGSIDVEDVSLVEADAGTATAVFEENRLHALGEPAFAATLFEIDTVVLSGIQALASAEPALGGVTPLQVQGVDNGIAIALANEGAADRLVFRAEPSALTGGVATLGEGGFRTHSAAFERDNATALLVGAGSDLLNLSFEEPVRLVGRPAGAGFRFEVDLRPGARALLQLDFREERAAAAGLAARGRAAEEDGRSGASLALWNELLDRYPYERGLVQEAEDTRSRLIQAGMQDLQQLALEVERARFFELADLFREVRAEVETVAQRFEGSEVAAACAELGSRIDAELAALELGRNEREVARLEAILAALEQAEMPTLAAAVKGHVEARSSAEGDR